MLKMFTFQAIAVFSKQLKFIQDSLMFSRSGAGDLKIVGIPDNNKMWSINIAESIFNEGIELPVYHFIPHVIIKSFVSI